ncbi:MAG: ATP synthase subunit I [Candidatus Kapaibacterium sp.]
MIEFIFEILLSMIIGLAAGAVYYGGLWLTLRRLDRRMAHIYVLLSFFGRLAIAVAAFWLAFLVGGIWGIIAALVAFIAAKLYAMRRAKIMKV